MELRRNIFLCIQLKARGPRDSKLQGGGGQLPTQTTEIVFPGNVVGSYTSYRNSILYYFTESTCGEQVIVVWQRGSIFVEFGTPRMLTRKAQAADENFTFPLFPPTYFAWVLTLIAAP